MYSDIKGPTPYENMSVGVLYYIGPFIMPRWGQRRQEQSTYGVTLSEAKRARLIGLRSGENISGMETATASGLVGRDTLPARE